ncbi:MAG TPA: hydantoinase/oxoprolinase family protein, partial [Planctomycetaceae bacterium]|nr:hydantoinase/oxoprolinase family protein [Planctomycetaceae bacterium]
TNQSYPSHPSDKSDQTKASDGLADGLCQIANANMVRAIRKISVARGYDPADYVLVCFGGAGAQHACAMAVSLGMRRILIHPLASLLSAYGIGLADVRRFGERSVLKPYSAEQLTEMESLFAELEETARTEVAAEGIPPDRIRPAVRSLDLRYVGVEAAIRVTSPPDGDYVAKYEELHRQLYGYTHSGRTLEITAARVEVVGTTVAPVVSTQEVVARRPTPDEATQTFLNGAWHETAVFFRENLRPGDKLTGPALISEPSSTIVVELGWDARVLDRGEVLLMSRTKSVRRQTQQALISSTTGRLSQPQIERRVQEFREYLSSIHLGVNRDRALIAQEVFAFVGPFDEQQLLKNMAEHPKARHVAR